VTHATEETRSGATPHVIRVLCVDDHAFLIEGLRARLSLEKDIEVVEHLETADSLIDVAKAMNADVCLIDIDMPGRDPFEAIEDLCRRVPKARPVLLSAFVRDAYIDEAMRCGVWGYLSKRDEPTAIIEGIRRVASGRLAFSGEVLERCGLKPDECDLIRTERPQSRLAILTPREMQILRMIGKGMSRNEIAEAIHRSPKTVDAHRASIMEKLGLHDRVDLARFAIREGLVEV
jgi:DNA-binding NarL/FixJ family response regulator